MKEEIENRRQKILNPSQKEEKPKLPGTDLTDE